MRILVLDTTTRWCSICLIEADAVIAHQHQDLGRGHAEHLIPFVSELPDGGRCDAIWVNRGPGSFTGVRIGLAAARALALAWDVPLSGYGGLQAISAAARAQYAAVAQSPHAVIIPGGHGEYFAQMFDVSGAAAGVVQSLSRDDCVTQIDCPWLIGDAAEEIAQARGHGEVQNIGSDARHAAFLSHDMIGPDTTPDYARAPDAKPVQ